MIFFADRRTGGINTRTSRTWVALLLVVASLTGCSGGGSTTQPADPVVTACNPADPSTAAECGTVLIGLTDADGDFLSYTVDVLSLTLHKANGTVVETLPRSTRIDFANYVDLTEFISAKTIPPGTYVAGSIRLDYSNAEVVVAAGGESRPATVVDAHGNVLTQTEMKIDLSDREQLLVTRGRTALLTVDFDLAASHTVDLLPTPALATAEPFIVAEVDPVDHKDIRVRGLLDSVNEAAMSYTVRLRPFHDRDGDFGRVEVKVTRDTEFEVNGDVFSGSEGLRALHASGPGTPTVARGTLNVLQREFTARLVLAGSSVPGLDRDAVHGNVISRSATKLVIRGATILRPQRDAYFHDDVVVTVGPDTKVWKSIRDGALDISAISIGQQVTVRGEVTVSDDERVHLDATNGAVRLHITHLSGLVNAIVPGQTEITLQSIDRRRVEIFDFAGTGTSTETDADPDNYEIATGNMLLNIDNTGQPVVVYGFPNSFGAAPPDFEGLTIVDFSDVQSVLGVGWGTSGTIAPYLSIGSDGLLLNNQNPDIDQRHHIKQDPVLIALTGLDSNTLIAPRETGRKLFIIKTGDSVQLYSDFDDFVNALTLELDGSTTARSMFARGHYDGDSNVFSAYKIGVYLLEP